MKNKNYLSNITDSSKVHELQVTVNNIDLITETISDIQINFGKVSKGKITFLDTIGIVEYAPLTFTILRISFSDSSKIKFSNEYIVTKTNITRYKDGGTKINLYFEEAFQYALKNMYISKTFKNKTIIEMLQELFNTHDIATTLVKHPDDYVHDFFVFPKNISMWDFLNLYLVQEGYTYYCDASGIKILNRKFLEFSNLPEEKGDSYTLKFSKDKPHFNILEYSGTFSNTDVVKNIAQYNKNKLNIEELKYNFDFKGIATIQETENLNGGYIGKSVDIKSVYPKIGFREIDEINHFGIIGLDEDYRDMAIENQKLKIVVEGTNIERLYHVINIEIPTAKNIKNNKGDSMGSGKYVVTEVVDKIISGMFIQVLTIQSLDYPKGNW
jgi:hypothetical protein